MPFIHCQLPHTINVVIPPDRFVKATENYPHAIPSFSERVEVDLVALSEYGVPTLLGFDRNKELKITFCTPRYEIVCGLTNQKDAYYAYHIAPLSIRTHNQLAHGAVGVTPNDWRLHQDVADLNRRVSGSFETHQSGYQEILAAWQRAMQKTQMIRSKVIGPTVEQANFLANMEALIYLVYETELDKVTLQDLVPVTGVESVAKARISTDYYLFKLAKSANVKIGDYLRAGIGEIGSPSLGYTGTVEEVTEQNITMRFYQQVDLSILERVEWLMPWISTKQRNIQLTAVQALLDNRAMNEQILQVIVNNQYQHYDAPIITRGKGRLNPAQMAMIERALVVPDVLLVLGPPGTGKTHTIREVVTRQIEQKPKKRVLVTSKNNMAVDNVLEALDNVNALRIGREEVISSQIHPLMIDNKARQLQSQILERILPTLQVLESLKRHWPQIQTQADQIRSQAQEWRLGQSRLDHQKEVISSWQQHCYRHVERVIARHLHDLERAHACLNHIIRKAEKIRKSVDNIRRLERVPLIGSIITLRIANLYDQWVAYSKEYEHICKDIQRSQTIIQESWGAYYRYVTESDVAMAIKKPAAEAENALVALRKEINTEITKLSEVIGQFNNAPSFHISITSPETLEAIHWPLRDWHKQAMDRRNLLLDWQALLQSRHQALYPTLIQTADVVGATCIGVATDSRFEDLEFDLVIADEAGQIPIIDLLVPLVRAKRAVLVGDHHQLPQVVERGVVQKIDPMDKELLALLEQSLFEILYKRISKSSSHLVNLNIQYRMPGKIANFISHHFYDNDYRTGKESMKADPFFPHTTMVFVDTIQEQDRRERPFIQPAEGIQGYTNPLEARLITDLVLAYQTLNIQWGVIVPYKKQAEKIRLDLHRRNKDLSSDILSDYVATVDSFQGKERDVIIFGFTRSNSHGRIGFFTELRRLNVSMTRARNQLIMVGDSGTLTNSVDYKFSNLMKSLISTVQSETGGYIYSYELPRYLSL